MKFNKALKISLGALIAFPLSFIVVMKYLVNNLSERFEEQLSYGNLLACGGGGGGSSPADKAIKKLSKQRLS